MLRSQVLRPDGLRAIFDHEQVVLSRDCHDLVHPRRLTEQVHDHDALGPRRDRGRQFRRIEIECSLLDVREHRRRPHVADAPRRRDERERRRDDLVSRLETGDHARDVKRRRAAVHAKDPRVTERRAEIPLEILDVLAEAESRRVVRRGQGRERLLTDRTVLKRKIEKRNLHG